MKFCCLLPETADTLCGDGRDVSSLALRMLSMHPNKPVESVTKTEGFTESYLMKRN